MLNRLPLRTRVTLAYGLMGLILSIGFGVAAKYVAEDYEHIIVEQVLAGQAQSFLLEVQRNAGVALPQSAEFSVYREDSAPSEFRGLAPGLHEPDLPGREGLHVGVYGPPGNRLVLIVDIGAVETLEGYLDRLMLLIVVIGSALSAWLGWLFAGRTVAPVYRLADAVERLPTQPALTRLETEFGHDAVGRLAGAIDAYQQRLVEAGETERLFYANANHELRTPIAVIQGAVEVMRDDPGVDSGQRLRLARIDRGVLELSLLLEAFMLSARGVGHATEGLEFLQVAQQARDRISLANPEASTRLRFEGGQLVLRVPPRVLECILAVLFHRLLNLAPVSTWTIQYSDHGFQVKPQDWGPRLPELGVRQSDLGLGLMFIDRLCRDLGWRLEQQSDTSDRLQIRVTFPEGQADQPNTDLADKGGGI